MSKGSGNGDYMEFCKKRMDYNKAYYKKYSGTGNRAKYTQEECDLILKHEFTDRELAVKLNRSIQSIQLKRFKLKSELGLTNHSHYSGKSKARKFIVEYNLDEDTGKHILNEYMRLYYQANRVKRALEGRKLCGCVVNLDDARNMVYMYTESLNTVLEDYGLKVVIFNSFPKIVEIDTGVIALE